jgi:hypothetical protein
LPPGEPKRAWPFARLPVRKISGILLLTCAVLFLDGYHPFANDAGIYAAGIRRLLDPSLYRPDAAFVLAHTRLSIFAHVLAGVIRLTHLPLPGLLFAAHLASVFLFLLACSRLAERLFLPPAERLGAIAMAAACFTLPVAGTALAIMDPYVTARSFSTPCALFALAACLDRAWGRAGIFAVAAFLLHPLMAAYLIAFLVLQALVESNRPGYAAALCAAGMAACAAAFLLARHAPVPEGYREAILLPSHTFLFLARWQWYEILGLVLPLLLLAWAAWRFGRSSRLRSTIGGLCLTCLLIGITSLVIAAGFVLPGGPYLLVPLQVLRSFHLIYALGVLLLGGLCGGLVTRSRWAGVCFAVPLLALSLSQHQTWRSSAFVEWPGAARVNPWQQAFLWIRGNTPRDAVFAFNPGLVYLPTEEEQGFRAIAERSHLADDKDGGVVAVFPRLAPEWARERNAETGIDFMSDEERLQRLQPLGVTWMLLAPDAVTSFPCPYRDRVVAVCRLP